jgi:hypothetical protein
MGWKPMPLFTVQPRGRPKLNAIYEMAASSRVSLPAKGWKPLRF